MSNKPSPTELDGRDRRGRFGRGNRYGRGNPLAAKVQKLRVALVRAVTPDDLQAVARALLTAAKAGDTGAAKLLFDRTLGPAAALDLDLRLRELEQGEP